MSGIWRYLQHWQSMRGSGNLKKGITTSPGLWSPLHEETGIAMLPGSDFGIDQNILVSQISYVDFDDKTALDAVRLDLK